MQTLGLIAGNGQFPFLLLDAARARNLRVVVAAIQQETDEQMNTRAAADSDITVHWLSLGDLSKLIETFQREGVTEAVMAGQVRHKQIFSSIRPDWRLAKLLLNLRTRNTDMLLGAVARVLEDEGIRLISSTAYLEPLLARSGTLTARAPNQQERDDIAYGLRIAKHLAAVDLGQTVVIAAAACVAVEAMEGTDSTILRAGQFLNGTATPERHKPSSSALTVVKVAKPNQDLRFDVPVIGVPTIETMHAGRCHLPRRRGPPHPHLQPRSHRAAAANAAGIAITGDGSPSACPHSGRCPAHRISAERFVRNRPTRRAILTLTPQEHHDPAPRHPHPPRPRHPSAPFSPRARPTPPPPPACLPTAVPPPPSPCPRRTNKPVSLADYKGKWVVLYFYPKDKTSAAAPLKPTTFSATRPNSTSSTQPSSAFRLTPPRATRAFAPRKTSPSSFSPTPTTRSSTSTASPSGPWER